MLVLFGKVQLPKQDTIKSVVKFHSIIQFKIYLQQVDYYYYTLLQFEIIKLYLKMAVHQHDQGLINWDKDVATSQHIYHSNSSLVPRLQEVAPFFFEMLHVAQCKRLLVLYPASWEQYNGILMAFCKREKKV